MITKEQQLKDKRNFLDQGRLFLVHCVACNSENWAIAVASGYCAFCHWKDKDDNRREETEDKRNLPHC